MSLAIWSLAAQNVLLYHLVPGGIKCFIVPFGPWRDKCFIVPFGPWRHKFYKHATPLGSIFIIS